MDLPARWAGQEDGRGKVVCILASHLSRMYTMCESCMQDVMCLDGTCYIRNVCNSL